MTDHGSTDWLSGGAGLLVLLVGVVVWLVFFVAGIRIIQKAGYSGWWILVTFVPLLNVVMYLVFAYSTWPAQRELEAWRAWGRGQQPPPVPPGPQVPPPPGGYYPGT